jgi:hypothetical protein
VPWRRRLPSCWLSRSGGHASHLVEIRTQSAREDAEEPGPGPVDRTETVSKWTEEMADSEEQQLDKELWGCRLSVNKWSLSTWSSPVRDRSRNYLWPIFGGWLYNKYIYITKIWVSSCIPFTATAAMFTFHSQVRREGEDLRLYSITNTHEVKVRMRKCILFKDTKEGKTKVWCLTLFKIPAKVWLGGLRLHLVGSQKG